MYRTSEECFKIIYEVYNKYSNFDVIAEEIRSSSDNVVKSYNNSASIYGMYYPDPIFYKYIKYRGRVTKSDTKFTYKYFYKGDKVYLTEQYEEEYDLYKESSLNKFELLSYIFYFYYNDHTDVVCYKKYRGNNEISFVGRVMYKNGKIDSFIESEGFINSIVTAYNEYQFIEGDKYAYVHHYHIPNGLSPNSYTYKFTILRA